MRFLLGVYAIFIAIGAFSQRGDDTIRPGLKSRPTGAKITVHFKDGTTKSGHLSNTGYKLIQENGESEKIRIKDVLCIEKQADFFSAKLLTVRVSVVDRKIKLSEAGVSQKQYLVLSDSLLIYYTAGGSGNINGSGGNYTATPGGSGSWTIWDLTVNREMKSKKNIQKAKPDKVKAVLLRHFSDCTFASEIIDSYEGNRYKDKCWEQVLTELYRACPDKCYNIEEVKKALLN